MNITDTAETVLKKRYYLKGETSWEDVCQRVAVHFGQTDKEVDSFYQVMADGNFLPNSPALMNAGTDIEAYSACYVLPIEDNIDSIYKFYSDAAKISKSGGGVGANYSKLRAANSLVQSTQGVASGPLSFMKVQNISTDIIKQGGRRRGANMGILSCDHPDIWDFIKVKDTPGELENFNLSVGITNGFMEDVTKVTSRDYGVITERQKMWQELTQRAWASAEPGVLFMDAIERGNTIPHLGTIEAVNPCGEQPLLPYESCTLGSINLSNHVATFMGFPIEQTRVDWDKLKETVHTATLLLNRVLDASTMPIPECQEAMEATRKIGLGIMGLHDMLIQLDLPYDSEEGRLIASKVMEFISEEADRFSTELGDIEGNYAAYIMDHTPARRNANLTTIAPTGTLSMIADCSSGCEPYYSAVTYKTVLDGTTFPMYNKWVTILAEKDGITNEEALVKYANLLKGANDIHWSDHVKMQAVLQKHVDSSISKTINMPNNATVEDVRAAYELAYELGCKGITVYRDGSRAEQVLSTDAKGLGTGGDDDTKLHRGYTGNTSPCSKAELPDTLKAIRYRVRVGEQKVYIIICEDADGFPREVFAKFPYAADSNWNSLCRSLSLAMRYGIPLSEIVKQLDKSVRVINDMPSQLSRILKTYQSNKGESVTAPCPECNSQVIFTEGCEKCTNCGWSKCG